MCFIGQLTPYSAASSSLTGIVEPEPGWLLCNDAAVSRTTYCNLFAKIGSAYGTGDGSTTFNLPDFREGRVLIGMGATNFTTLAASGGEINHTLSTSELASHSHGIAVYDGTGTGGYIKTGWTDSGASQHDTGGMQSAGGAGAHNNMPPDVVVGGWLIKC